MKVVAEKIPAITFWFIGALIIFYYFPITNLWWMFDDTQHLKLVSITGLDVFYKKAEEVGYIPANFTPWLYFNYWIDLKLFGLTSRGGFFHQLLSLAFVIISVFFLLKRIIPPLIASGVILYFFFTPVAHTVIHILCTRHYLEGLGYVCLALTFLLIYRERNLLIYLYFSLMFAFISFLNKEVYISFVAIPCCLYCLDYIENKRKENGIMLWLYLLIAFIYILYRGYALGWDRLLTGYGSAVQHRGIVEIFHYIKEIIQFNELRFLAIFFVFAFFYYLFILVKANSLYLASKFLIFFFLLLVCVLAPIYKVMPTANVNHNYIFLPTFILIFGAGYLVSQIIQHNSGIGIKLAIGSIFGLMIAFQHFKTLPGATLNVQNNSLDLFQRFRVEGEYLLYSKDSPSHKLLDPIGAPWHHSGILDLRKGYLKLSDGPTICYQHCDCKGAEVIYTYKSGILTKLTEVECKSD